MHKIGDTVRNKRTGNIYFVLRIKLNGRLVLWYHGKRRIDDADPADWPVVEVKSS